MADSENGSFPTDGEGDGGASTRRIWKGWEGVIPQYIRWACFSWQFIKFMFIFYLCCRQHVVLNERRRIPRVLFGKLPPETFNRARTYHTELNYLKMVLCFWMILVEVWIILYYAGFTKYWFLSGPILDWLGIWPDGWDQETGESIIFSVFCVMHINCFSLPIELWRVFIVEEKYGFNKMSAWQYVKEFFKMLFLECLIGVLTGVAVLWIVKETGKLFFIWLWLFSFGWVMLTVAVYPHLIAPIFDDYTPLREGRLRNRLKKLANFLGFPLEEILVLHQSWRSEHRSAYFYGLLGAKRIVIYDTILEGYPEADSNDAKRRGRIRMAIPRKTADGDSITSVPSRILQKAHFSEFDTGGEEAPSGAAYPTDKPASRSRSRMSMYDTGFTEYEIEAIVARLMGDWVLGHAVKQLVLPLANMFLFYVIFSLVYEHSTLFKAFDVPREMETPILLGLRLLYMDVMDIYNVFVLSFMRYLERSRHFDSDAFATKLGYGEDLIDAYIESDKENLDYPFYDTMYWNFFNYEPSLLHKLAAIEEEMKRMEWKVD